MESFLVVDDFGFNTAGAGQISPLSKIVGKKKNRGDGKGEKDKKNDFFMKMLGQEEAKQDEGEEATAAIGEGERNVGQEEEKKRYLGFLLVVLVEKIGGK